VLIVGLMTGTSLDGIDAALVEIEGSSVVDLRWKLLEAVTLEHAPARREAIHDGITGGDPRSICSLNVDMGEWLAEAVSEVCDRAGVGVDRLDLIGSHGQTIWHSPPIDGRRGATFQIGCPATIAERTGVAVVSDFRSRDMAAGGQGAPLVAWVDQILFSLPDRTRALQNLGGIGNVTLVPPRGSTGPVSAFDTGPGNSLIDAAVTIATAGRLTYDRDGLLAARGEVDSVVLAELLDHPFFDQMPPRSTGREVFGRHLVEGLVAAIPPEGDRDWLDLIATLTEFTARSIADSYRRWLPADGIDEVVVTGGGALNPTLMRRIRELVGPPVREPGVLGIGPTEKESMAFAVLAWAYVHGIPANQPSATGAAGPRVLGSFTPGKAAEEVDR